MDVIWDFKRAITLHLQLVACASKWSHHRLQREYFGSSKEINNENEKRIKFKKKTKTYGVCFRIALSACDLGTEGSVSSGVRKLGRAGIVANII